MRTPLYQNHIRMGAHMVDFHGWDMPLYYSSIMNEHMLVRKNVGLFDVSHMGDVLIEGDDAIDFINYLIPTDISRLEDNKCVYTAFLDQDGLIIDDTIFYRLSEKKFFFVPNASTTPMVFSWINSLKQDFNVKISDLSADIACIAVQGPLSVKIAEVLSFHMPDPFTFSFSPTHSMNGLTNSNDMIISGTGYTGERGFEIILPSQDSPDLWDKIYKIADKIGGGLCGLGARDTLRMEKGMLLSGTDFNHDRDPFECSIGFIVNNGNDFVGKNNLISRKGVDKEIFRGFILKEKSIPRSGFEIYYEGKKIGRITSGTMSPILNKSIGLGFINKENAKPGSEVEIVIRDKKVQAEVSRPKIVP